MKENEFRCAVCGGIFEKAWTDEEKVAEFQSYFGHSMRPEECATVCDDCYNKMHPANHPHEVEAAVAETLRERKP